MIECRALEASRNNKVNGLRNTVSSASSGRDVPYIIDDEADQACNIEEKVAGTEPWNGAIKPVYDPGSVSTLYSQPSSLAFFRDKPRESDNANTELIQFLYKAVRSDRCEHESDRDELK